MVEVLHFTGCLSRKFACNHQERHIINRHENIRWKFWMKKESPAMLYEYNSVKALKKGNQQSYSSKSIVTLLRMPSQVLVSNELSSHTR